MRQLSEFKDDLFSWLLYCTTLDAASAQSGFKAALAHEAWPEQCGHWFALATQLEARGDWRALDWMTALAEKLMTLVGLAAFHAAELSQAWLYCRRG